MPNRQRVLIVEDEPAVRDLIASILTFEGYAVHTAGNGEEALGLVATANPQVILVDLMMPVMDGWTFLDRYAAGGGGAHLVVLSALSPHEQHLERHPVRAVLQKPFDIDRLLETVASAAGGA